MSAAKDCAMIKLWMQRLVKMLQPWKQLCTGEKINVNAAKAEANRNATALEASYTEPCIATVEASESLTAKAAVSSEINTSVELIVDATTVEATASLRALEPSTNKVNTAVETLLNGVTVEASASLAALELLTSKINATVKYFFSD
jgi:hypothetical protein